MRVPEASEIRVVGFFREALSNACNGNKAVFTLRQVAKGVLLDKFLPYSRP